MPGINSTQNLKLQARVALGLYLLFEGMLLVGGVTGDKSYYSSVFKKALINTLGQTPDGKEVLASKALQSMMTLGFLIGGFLILANIPYGYHMAMCLFVLKLLFINSGTFLELNSEDPAYAAEWR